MKHETQFIDIFNLEEIQKIQDLFSDTMGVASIITQPDGTPITKASNFTRLCGEIIRETEKGCANCIKSDGILGILNPMGVTVKACLSGGLWDASVSINIGETHLANWLIGQVQNEKTDKQEMLHYAVEIGANPDEFMKALSEVPTMSENQFNKTAELLFVMANELSEKAYTNLQLKREMEERERATTLLQKSEEALSLTLNSIGDGVISTDIYGFIVEMNPVAQKLCGWKLAEAKGKPLTEVFKIINSETRAIVDNPARMVLQSGQIVGLANHTALISKDGTEYQIADSAAPIKNNKGVVTGVVLVFSDVTEKYEAQKAQLESESKYRDLVNNSPDAIAIFVDGTLVLVNNECIRLMHAATEDDVLGKNVMEFVHPDNRLFVAETMVNEVDQQSVLSFDDLRFVRLDGSSVDVDVKAMNIFFEHQPAIQVIFRDVTDRKIAEQALQESQKRFNTLFMDSPDAYLLIEDGVFVDCNRAAENILLGTRSQIIGQTPNAISPEFQSDGRKSSDAATENINYTPQHGNTTFEWIHRRFDGSDLYVEVSLSSINLDGKQTLFTTWRDISKRKQAEESLQKQHSLLRTIIDNLPDAIYAKDLTGAKTLANTADIHNIAAKSELEVLGKTDFELFPKEIAEKFFVNDQIVLKKGIPIHRKEEYLKDENGNIRWLHTSKFPLFDQNQQIIGLVGVGRDITEQKLALESLENERLLLRTVIDNIPDTIYAKDLYGRKTLANKAEVEFLGAKSEAEVLGKDDFEFYDKEFAENFKIADELLLKSGEPDFNREGQIINANGKEMWTLSSRLPLRDNNNQIIGLVGIGRDITNRKMMEESLRESEEHYRTLVERMPDGVYKSTHDGQFVNVNPALVKLLGYDSIEELLSIDIKTQLYFEPGDRESLVLEQDLLEMGIYRLKKKDGSAIWIEDHGWYNLNEDNQVVFHEGVVRDITSRLEAEQALSKSREELKSFAAHLQNIREEEKVMLAREIHDDLGQILVAMKIDLGLLKKKLNKEFDKIESKDFLSKFDDFSDLLYTTIETTRRIMTGLRSEQLELLGFIEASKVHINDFVKRFHINCNFECEITELKINPQQSIALFRILQEALSNVSRHAKATEVKVLLRIYEGKLILEIIDNGIGFENGKSNRTDSYGLIGMKERVFLLGGEFIIDGQLGVGTTVRVEMPYFN